jgi:hypothetical protein
MRTVDPTTVLVVCSGRNLLDTKPQSPHPGDLSALRQWGTPF